MVGNLSAVIGSLIAVCAMVVRYLIPLWPAEGVDPNRVNLHIEILQYSGVVLAVGGAFLIARKSASKFRRTRILVLSGAILAMAALSAYRDTHQLSPTNPSTRPEATGKYRFSVDWISLHTSIWGEFLAELKGKADIHALEVGSFEGRSTLWFLENILTDPSSTITCIDIWVGAYENTFDDNIKSYGQPGKVIKIKSSSDVALRQLKLKSYDFIYIDGSHVAKDVLVDAVLAWDLLKPGGIMIFDDYDWVGIRSWLAANYTPKIAVNAFVDIFGPYMDLLHKDSQVAIKKKDPKDVDLETFKPLRSFILSVQHVLG